MFASGTVRVDTVPGALPDGAELMLVSLVKNGFAYKLTMWFLTA
jgi:hypothetical protein